MTARVVMVVAESVALVGVAGVPFRGDIRTASFPFIGRDR